MLEGAMDSVFSYGLIANEAVYTAELVVILESLRMETALPYLFD